MTNLIPAIGATSLGICIGWLVRFFMRRFRKFSPTVLSSVISLTFGGVAIKFLGADGTVLWFYPIGVLIGFIVYTIIAVLAIRNGGEVANSGPNNRARQTFPDFSKLRGANSGRYTDVYCKAPTIPPDEQKRRFEEWRKSSSSKEKKL